MTAETALYQTLLVLTPLAPLVLCTLLWGAGARDRLISFVPWAALPGLLLALLPDGGSRIGLDWLLLGGQLGLDGMGRVFLLLTALLWMSAGLHLRQLLSDDSHARRFAIFFLLAMGGNLGVALSLDMLGFYLFFALMSFSSYALVVHDGRDFSRRAGRVYLILVLMGEVLLFTALVMLARHTPFLLLSEASSALAGSEQRNLILAILITALGIKLGMVPLHFWLPLAHPAAPVPASAVLSGAMIKAGLLGLARLLPLGQVALPGWSGGLVVAGLVMAYYGVVVGLPQRKVKTVLAYSSISQMGYGVIALGLGLAQPGVWPQLAPVLAFYALHHGLAKGALFLGVSMAPVSGMSVRLRRLAVLGLLWPALALSGAPFTSGAQAKAALKPFLKEAPAYGPFPLSALLSCAAVGTALIMARFLFLMYRKPSDRPSPGAAMWGGWLLLLTGSIVCAVGWFPDPWLHAALQSVSVAPVSALWPLLLALLIAVAAMRRLPQAVKEVFSPPPGDVGVLVEKFISLVCDAFRKPWALIAGGKLWKTLRLPRGRWWHRLAVYEVLHETELSLRRFPVAGAVFLFILLLFIL
ncbi:MAG: complex I subunit 5 family protein [Thermodesulfobacteriota bacterium]|jgi:formate hydrogenlyase subunit 3/multisubunit Na+/H+ antiporter MnhD subunit|nr:complex I subunit 5 family protein [Thermodesulfobacteriota bacterium]